MYKLEMHLHTIGRSTCAKEEPAAIAEIYARAGYHGIVCTNHYIRAVCDDYYRKGSPAANCEFYLDGYRDLKRECAARGIDVFLGMELCVDSLTYFKPEPPYAEMLLYGLEPELLQSDPERLFSMTQREVYEFAEENGLLVFQSHPFRDRITRLDPKYLHGVEVYNGHPAWDSRNDLAERFAEENGLLRSAGSDFHFAGGEGSGVYLERRVSTNAELVAELRRGKHAIFRRTDPVSSSEEPADASAKNRKKQ